MALDIYAEIVAVTLSQFPAVTTVTSINLFNNGITPKAVVLLGARQPSVTPTVEDGGGRNVLGFAVNGGSQVGCGAVVENVGAGQTSVQTRQRNDRAITELNEAPSIGVIVSGWVVGGVQLTYTPTSSPNKIIYVMLIGGADVTAYADAVQISGTVPFSQSVTAPGFQPDAVLFTTINVTTLTTSNSFVGQQFGLATATKNRSVSTSVQQSFFTSNPMCEAVWNDCAVHAVNNATGVMAWKAAVTMTASGFDFGVTGSTNPPGDYAMYLALKLNGGPLTCVDIVDWNTPSSTGIATVASGLAYLPGAMIAGHAGLSTWGIARNTDPACVAGIGMAAVNVEGGNAWRSNRSSNPLNNGTLTDPHVVRLGSKSSMTSGGNLAALSAWSPGQVDLNYSAVNQPGTQSFALVFYNKAGLIPSAVRLPYTLAEVFTDGVPNVRTPLVFSEAVAGGVPSARAPLIFSEPVVGGQPGVRCPFVFVEIFHSIAPEIPVATEILPISSPINAPLSLNGEPPLVGLTWDVEKRPRFRTDIQSAVTGKELRTARMQYPIYEFKLSFELLREKEGHQELERLMGFFMTQLGSWGSWLYQDPTDYSVESQLIGVADGGLTGFTVVRTMKGFTDPVGQVDFQDLFVFLAAAVNTGTDTISVPKHGLATGYGPLQLSNPGTLPTGLAADTNYWIISTGTNTLKLAASKADALAGTAVDITAIGAGTNTAANSIAVYVAGVEVDPDDYTFATPNEIIFDSAPLTGDVTVDCKFYFVCRFMQDVADFNNWSKDLWELETLEFQSIV